MRRVNTYKEAMRFLEQGEVLVYKPYHYKPAYLSLVKEDRIAVFNDNMRYNISFQEFDELIQEFKMYIFEKENDIEIDPEFRNIRQ